MSSHFASENHGLAHVLEAHAAVHVHVFNFEKILNLIKMIAVVVNVAWSTASQ